MMILLLVLGCGVIALAIWSIRHDAQRRIAPPYHLPHLGYPWWLGGEKKASPVPVKAKRMYGRGLCPYCGETDIPLRADGEPHRRFHRCESSRAPWPPAFVQTNEPQPPVTVTTWPPGPPEV
jgi:hypothetical protein